jgi:hypothetical protein
MEHQLDAIITVLLISKISSTCFGQTFARNGQTQIKFTVKRLIFSIRQCILTIRMVKLLLGASPFQFRKRPSKRENLKNSQITSSLWNL